MKFSQKAIHKIETKIYMVRAGCLNFYFFTFYKANNTKTLIKKSTLVSRSREYNQTQKIGTHKSNTKNEYYSLKIFQESG